MTGLTTNEKRCEKRILDALKDEDCTFDRLVHLTKFTPQTVRRILEYMGLEMDLDGSYSYPKNYKPTGILPPVKQQSSNETLAAPSVEPIPTTNKQQPIKETTVSNSTQNQPKNQAMQESALMKLTKSLESQLSILSNTGLSAERLEMELRRADGIAKIGKQMTDVGRLVLDANKFEAEFGKGRVDSNLLSMG